MLKASLETFLAWDELPLDVRVQDLVPMLEQGLASSDSYVREDLALVLFDRWIYQGHFSATQLRDLAKRMIANLQVGLDEPAGDSAFLRAYAVLVLFEIMGCHNQKGQLSAETLRHIQEETISYLLAEKDERVVVPGKGWIHAVPHGFNVLIETAKSRELGRHDLESILDAVYERARGSLTQVYTGFEEELFSLTVVAVLRRSLLSVTDFENWVERLVRPPEGSTSWSKHLLTPQPELILLANLKATLRALYLQLSFSSEPPDECEAYLKALRKGLETLDTGFYNQPPTE